MPTRTRSAASVDDSAKGAANDAAISQVRKSARRSMLWPGERPALYGNFPLARNVLPGREQSLAQPDRPLQQERQPNDPEERGKDAARVQLPCRVLQQETQSAIGRHDLAHHRADQRIENG